MHKTETYMKGEGTHKYNFTVMLGSIDKRLGQV
jgi:hypothetical protein